MIKIARNGEVIGEYEEAKAQALLSAGVLRLDDHYWMEGMSEWRELSHLLTSEKSSPNLGAKETKSRLLKTIPLLLGFGGIVTAVLWHGPHEDEQSKPAPTSSKEASPHDHITKNSALKTEESKHEKREKQPSAESDFWGITLDSEISRRAVEDLAEWALYLHHCGVPETENLAVIELIKRASSPLLSDSEKAKAAYAAVLPERLASHWRFRFGVTRSSLSVLVKNIENKALLKQAADVYPEAWAALGNESFFSVHLPESKQASSVLSDDVRAKLLQSDLGLAVEAYNQGALNGDAESLAILSVLHRYGIGVPKSELESERLLNQAAESPNGESLWRGASFLIYSRQCSRFKDASSEWSPNLDAAKLLLEIGASMGDMKCLMLLACPDPFDEPSSASDGADSSINAPPTLLDDHERNHWLNIAASKSYVPAQMRLSVMDRSPSGLEKMADRVKLYGIAAQQGDYTAAYALARETIYSNDDSMRSRYGIETLRLAVETLAYPDETIFPRFNEMGHAWSTLPSQLQFSCLKELARIGSPFAMRKLSELYFAQTAPNYIEALAWAYAAKHVANNLDLRRRFQKTEAVLAKDAALAVTKGWAAFWPLTTDHIEKQCISAMEPQGISDAKTLGTKYYEHARRVARVLGPGRSLHPSSRKHWQVRENILGGSGFLVSQHGDVVTNFHVASGNGDIFVQHSDKTWRKATLTRKDQSNDLALLKAEGNDWHPLPLSAKAARAGERVAALGYPNTDLQGTELKVTEGIINSTSGFQDDPRFYQFSAPIQPGNSGGPLVNFKGEVVGIVTAKLSERASLSSGAGIPQNVNYALKAALALPLLDGLLPAASPSPQTENEEPSLPDMIQRIRSSAVRIEVR